MLTGIPSRSRLARLLALPLLTAAAALAISTSCHAQAQAQVKGADIIVNYDQSTLITLSRAASEIIIGNPTIADVTVQSGTQLVVTGKTFGITNLIVLDAQRKTIQEQRILVKRDEVSVLNLNRGTQRQSYNCTPQCNPSITIGDDTGYFDTVSKASEKKLGFSERSNDGSQSGGQ